MEHEHARESLQSLPDDELLRRLAELLSLSRHCEAGIVAHIGEVDERRLYAREAAPSMFAYCADVLHLSEAEAYLRITAARAARTHPVLLEMLADGRLHLSGIARLVPHLSPGNREAILARAAFKSKRQILELVAELSPRPDVPAAVRKLPERRLAVRPVTSTAQPAQGTPQLVSAAVPEGAELELGSDRGVAVRPQLCPDRVATRIEPLSPGRFRVQFTADAALREKLERLQALMRSSRPGADLAAVIEDAVTEKLVRLEARRFGRTARPRKSLAESDPAPHSRHVPAAVRRAVHERDGGRCRYVDEQGRRCPQRAGLELHHRHPFGHGGDHGVENLCLLCRAHNSYLAAIDYGT